MVVPHKQNKLDIMYLFSKKTKQYKYYLREKRIIVKEKLKGFEK